MSNGPSARAMASSYQRKRKRHTVASINECPSPVENEVIAKQEFGVFPNWDAENGLPVGVRPQRSVKPKSGSGGSFFNKKTITQTRRTQDLYPSKFENEECLEIEDDILTSKVTRQQNQASSKTSRSVRVNQQSPFQISSSGLIPLSKQEHVSARVELSANTAWIDRFPPSGLGELAVNKKKVSEVSEWLREALKGRLHRRLLVLKGPAGCGKTTTVKLLAEQWNIQVIEWINPSKLEIEAENYASLSSRFDDFLNRGSIFTSLGLEGKTMEGIRFCQNQQARPGIILVDDFPTSVRHIPRALDSIRESIIRHLETEASTPAILIFSEEDEYSIDNTNALGTRSLLGSEILDHPAAATIEFNRLAPTFMIKAIEQVIKKEACISRRNITPSQAVLDRIVQSGDIRSAIGMLQLFCINVPGKKLTASIASTKKSSKSTLTNEEKASLEGILQRESFLGLFHAVGKIVYNKREKEAIFQPPSYLSKHHRRYQSDTDIEDIIDHLGVDVDIFVAALHENYIPSCESHDSLKSIEDASLELSSADILGGTSVSRASKGSERRAERAESVDFVRQNNIAFHTAARGLLFSLPFPVKRASHFHGKNNRKLMFPIASKLYGRQKEIQTKVDIWLRGSDAVATGKISLSASAHQKLVNKEAWGAFNNHGRLSDESFIPEMPTIRPVARLSVDELLQYQMPFTALLGERLNIVPGFQSLLDVVRLRSDKPHNIANASTASISIPQSSGTFSSPIRENNLEAASRLFLSDDDIEDN